MILTTTMVCGLKPAGWAMLAPAEIQAAAPGSARAADMKAIQGALESKILRERLKGFGLTDAEVNSRLSKLSDKEVHQFATRIHSVNPGGDLTVIGVLLVVVLVLFIIYLVKRV